MLSKVLSKDSFLDEIDVEKTLVLTKLLLKDFCVVESVFERLLCCRKCFRKTLVLSTVFLNDSCIDESVVERLLCCRQCF